MVVNGYVFIADPRYGLANIFYGLADVCDYHVAWFGEAQD